MRASVVMLGVFLIGTFGYQALAGDSYSWLQCLYMTVITVSTVGYTEIIAPTSDAIMVFNMGLIVFGGGAILYFAAATTALVLEGDLVHTMFRRRLGRALGKQRRHVIVCGLGGMGRAAAKELWRNGLSVVVIDRDEEALGDLVADIGEPLPFVMGDAFDHDALHEAGIERAHGLIVAMAEDRDNLYLTVMARGLSPELRIVSRASSAVASEKLRIAGADEVVSTPQVAARHLVQGLVDASIYSLNDLLFSKHGPDLGIEVVAVEPGSPWLGVTVGDIIQGAVRVVGLRARGETLFRYRPALDVKVEDGALVMVVARAAVLKDVAKRSPKASGESGARRAPLALDGRVVVAGGGTVGQEIALELLARGTPEIVVIEQDPERAEEVRELTTAGGAGTRLRVVEEDAFDESALETAGVRGAIALIAALPAARDNAFLNVSARRLNPDLRITSRADSDEEAERLRRVGADAVVSVALAGGRRLAQTMESPELADVADAASRHDGPELYLRELGIMPDSKAEGRRLDELRLSEQTGALVLAVRIRPGKPYQLRPVGTTRLDDRTTLIAMGEKHALVALDEYVIP